MVLCRLVLNVDGSHETSPFQSRNLSCPVERMTCVAKWKEGNKRYFVALVKAVFLSF